MNWYLEAFNNKFDFSGRAARPEFWIFFIANYFIGGIIGALALVGAFVLMLVTKTGGLGAGILAMMAGFGVLGLFSLLMVIPTLAVATRRLHDSGRSGKWLMLYFPVILLSLMETVTHTHALQLLGSLVGMLLNVTLLVFMLLPGSPSENQYGPPTSQN